MNLTKNSKSSKVTVVTTGVNQTFSLDAFKIFQKETLENAYKMAQKNWDKTHEDINSMYNHLKNSDQLHRNKNNTYMYNHLKNIDKTHCDTNYTYQHLENSNKTHKDTIN